MDMDQHQPKKQRGGRKAKAKKDEPKIPRPYTSWLIYFQLEREWILQKKLGVASSLDPEKAFVAADPRYNGPPLPSRYQDLTLPSDWWMPGKGDRRKRLHRKVRLQSLSCTQMCSWLCHCVSHHSIIPLFALRDQFRVTASSLSTS
jgi:hypothetical protein